MCDGGCYATVTLNRPVDVMKINRGQVFGHHGGSGGRKAQSFSRGVTAFHLELGKLRLVCAAAP
jgi:hypothetical protein